MDSVVERARGGWQAGAGGLGGRQAGARRTEACGRRLRLYQLDLGISKKKRKADHFEMGGGGGGGAIAPVLGC